jgi:BlaI family transcriptional regulator, penicillinase repressor
VQYVKISDAEWQVMRVVWKSGSVGAAEVIDTLVPQSGWSHRTVRTLLNRLVKKGVLTAELDGGRNIYRSRLGQSQCLRGESRSFLKKFFDGDAGEMLVYFIKHEDISADQIKQLKALLNTKQTKKK